MALEQPLKKEPSKKKRVLLVEDEPANMAIMAEYLILDGYDVTEAQNGAIAWDILQADAEFDVLVTDRMMPEMDGLQLSEMVKNDRRLSRLPVIMQTGASGQRDIAEGMKAGVFYYLPKPYAQETLVTIMRAAIADRQQRQLFEQRMGRQRDALDIFVSGIFSLHTIAEAQNLALLLGAAFKRPELAVNGLYELLLNAIEHGNLKLGYEAKNKALAEGAWDKEIARRMALPENAGKRVDVAFARNGSKIEITIRDQGDGFDARPYMEIEPSRAMQGNGRGIAKANLLAFERLEYLDKGNTVKVTGH